MNSSNSKLKNIYFFNKVIKNLLAKKLFANILTCGNDKMEGNPKEPMLSPLIHKTTTHNG
jgi:hypothetical protein